MLRCSELVCWSCEALMMDIMHMIDRDKIESSAPFALVRTSSVSNHAQGDTLLFDERICAVVEDQPNG